MELESVESPGHREDDKPTIEISVNEPCEYACISLHLHETRGIRTHLREDQES
jgi:hypothetical protein